jgi:hypothetical protein
MNAGAKIAKMKDSIFSKKITIYKVIAAPRHTNTKTNAIMAIVFGIYLSFLVSIASSP